jgi:hypothetical protein
MRITDEGEDSGDDNNGATRNLNNVLNNIKTGSTVRDDTPKINAEVNSSKLKGMLAGLRNSNE